ncbi:MAG: hypothetical protein ACJ78M_13870 [Gemmatimonadaceae bacterium]
MTSVVEIEAQARTYDEDALRVESGLGGIRILRGVSDSIVLTVGIVRPAKVSQILSASPNAVAEAKLFESNYRWGVWTAALGVAVWGGAFAINHIGTNQPVPVPITIMSLVLVTYGAMRADTAKRALSKAIWWYNRDLSR